MSHQQTPDTRTGHQTPSRTADTYGATLPPGAADQTSAPSSGRTAMRHLRFDVTEWRRAAARAAREGRGVAEVAGALVRAYGAGEIDAPAAASTARRPASTTTHHHVTSTTEETS